MPETWIYSALVICVVSSLVSTLVAVSVWTHQRTEEKHMLRPRDLAPIQERLNRLAEQQAEARGELTEVTRMLREQLRIFQSANMRSSQRA